MGKTTLNKPDAGSRAKICSLSTNPPSRLHRPDDCTSPPAWARNAEASHEPVVGDVDRGASL